MTEYTYKDVIIDPEDPRVEIGAEYYFGDYPNKLLSAANCGIQFGTLRDVKKDESSPFWIENRVISWAVLIRKKNPKKKYVPFDLSKPEVRDKLRGKWICKNNCRFETIITCFKQEDEGAEGIDSIYWTAYGQSSLDLLENWTFLDGTPCGELVEVEE